MKEIDNVKVFIHKAAAIGRTTFDNHIKDLDKLLTTIEDAGLQLNIRKTKWAVDEAKYLGYVVNKNGHKLDLVEVQALINMKPPKNKKQVRQFLGGVNFYRKTWEHQSHLLTPLSDLTKDVPFE